MSPELVQFVVLGGALVGAVAALLAFAGGHLYDGIGRGYLDMPDRADGAPTPEFDSWNGEAALETRQMIDASSALRRRHGKRTLDADARVRRILRELER